MRIYCIKPRSPSHEINAKRVVEHISPHVSGLSPLFLPLVLSFSHLLMVQEFLLITNRARVLEEIVRLLLVTQDVMSVAAWARWSESRAITVVLLHHAAFSTLTWMYIIIYKLMSLMESRYWCISGHYYTHDDNLTAGGQLRRNQRGKIWKSCFYSLD